MLTKVNTQVCRYPDLPACRGDPRDRASLPWLEEAGLSCTGIGQGPVKRKVELAANSCGRSSTSNHNNNEGASLCV